MVAYAHCRVSYMLTAVFPLYVPQARIRGMEQMHRNQPSANTAIDELKHALTPEQLAQLDHWSALTARAQPGPFHLTPTDDTRVRPHAPPHTFQPTHTHLPASPQNSQPTHIIILPTQASLLARRASRAPQICAPPVATASLHQSPHRCDFNSHRHQPDVSPGHDHLLCHGGGGHLHDGHRDHVPLVG